MRKFIHSRIQEFWKGLFRVLYWIAGKFYSWSVKIWNRVDYENLVDSTLTSGKEKYHRPRRWR